MIRRFTLLIAASFVVFAGMMAAHGHGDAAAPAAPKVRLGVASAMVGPNGCKVTRSRTAITVRCPKGRAAWIVWDRQRGTFTRHATLVGGGGLRSHLDLFQFAPGQVRVAKAVVSRGAVYGLDW